MPPNAAAGEVCPNEASTDAMMAEVSPKVMTMMAEWTVIKMGTAPVVMSTPAMRDVE